MPMPGLLQLVFFTSLGQSWLLLRASCAAGCSPLQSGVGIMTCLHDALAASWRAKKRPTVVSVNATGSKALMPDLCHRMISMGADLETFIEGDKDRRRSKNCPYPQEPA